MVLAKLCADCHEDDIVDIIIIDIIVNDDGFMLATHAELSNWMDTLWRYQKSHLHVPQSLLLDLLLLVVKRNGGRTPQTFKQPLHKVKS